MVLTLLLSALPFVRNANMNRKWNRWGYKDMEESMHPYYYSCPLSYLELVPIDQYGGNAAWRAGVQQYHALQAEKRLQRRSA